MKNTKVGLKEKYFTRESLNEKYFTRDSLNETLKECSAEASHLG